MSLNIDPIPKQTNLSAEAAKSALPNSIINIKHIRGLHSRGGENKLVSDEVNQPALTIEDGIYMADGKPISKAEYLRITSVLGS
ncbi:MAG: hypothetical protein UU12_C0002G0003 [Candidatus Woesebacteria bacterium GW2011_GWA2_40_7b]|uniref:Uncharacterized protein n=1 Tax=Candidatus Woesebacteria bacterium GW2011_GWA2_40_7b TaxID=1618563 RepID=A0A0G0VH26_9BACT|nr:MAG: hypothetical protein UU12_C0002G0003 [Candidatus Woesebacteria bacterium GW2011_GWA2_40_7b]